MAKISVIIPVYNVEKYLKEAINSILCQTMNDLEIIVVDDGSKDKCPEIIDECASKDNRIIAIHKQNGGYGQAMNRGLEKATGEYIAILEPDDYIDSNMYKDLYDIAKKYDSDIVKSGFFENMQCSKINRIIKIKWNDYIPQDKSFTIKEYPYFLYYHPSIWSAIYKREFLNKNNIRFIEAKGSSWTDNPFSVQALILANSINYTSKAYYYWRRLNYSESDDLKDYTIPFERTDEIHNWLDENNINDENIKVQLFRRELAYINIVLGMKKIEDEDDCYKRIKALISRCPKTFLKNKDVRKDEIKTYLSIKNNPKLARTRILIKKIRKSIISIRWNNREKSIHLFGKLYSFGTINTGSE